MTEVDLDGLAQVALARDFDPIPWETAPFWRREAARAVAKAAVGTFGLGAADLVRSAWTHAMCEMGWQWGPLFDETTKRHPGIVFGELTRGGIVHWTSVVDAIRRDARRRGVRLTGE